MGNHLGYYIHSASQWFSCKINPEERKMTYETIADIRRP
jgi:hypothetical protein